ncbi:chemotaxis signal transduction protein [Bradyrhizobium sp. LM6.10]
MDETHTGEHQVDAMQVVMIGLGEEKFALDAGLVREIIDPVPVTKVAGARAFVPSVINVRGNVIPLADLRIRFGMPQPEDSADTRIVVIELESRWRAGTGRRHRRQGLRGHGDFADRRAADTARRHALEAGVHSLHRQMA